jgi:2-polyprenyl-3-methyl-5-hydroxy-6-metoxy-1,4-benzoquinol methylase
MTNIADGIEELACPLCDSQETRVRYRKFGFAIVRCRRCGLAYVNPRPPKQAVLQRYSAEYFENEYLPAQGVVNGRVDPDFFDMRYAQILALIESHVQGKGRLLEIGCGAGLFLAAAGRAGWRVSGIEVSSAAVAFCRDTLGVDVVECAAEQISATVPPVDVVVMFDVIEHLFDPMAVLGVVRSILRPGGMLVITTPNFSALSRLVLGPQWAILSPLEHLFYFSETTLRRALTRHAFADVRFVRRYGAWSVRDTMNPRSTHAPNSWRAALYEKGVQKLGSRLYRFVQNAGRGDILLAIARAR